MGGTFTDFVIVDDRGAVTEAKTPSTPAEPGAAIRHGLEELGRKLEEPVGSILRDCQLLIHGTTVALNTLLQHRGAKTGLICTAGFRDSLEIRLGYRDARYDFRVPPPPLLVPRHLRLPVQERVDKTGTIVAPLKEKDVYDAARHFDAENVEAVAVCLLWSFYNPSHERKVGQILRERLPEVYISLSVDVAPQIREYDRTSTTVLNAYVGPRLAEYVWKTEEFLRSLGYSGEIRYAQSNGGLASGDVIQQRAVLALNSGPATAPAAGIFFGRQLDVDNLITVDMGGTSFDACLIENGAPVVSGAADVHRYRVAVPMVNINTIGAGGGSIAWLDHGLLRVGPQSAEATPGPACYMRGGVEPTVTDADVVLGYLNPVALLGGQFEIDASLAKEAIEARIAKPLHLEVEEAALGIFEIVNRSMAGAISAISLERGYDPRDFTMVAGGGQGPVHAGNLARELGIPVIIIPRYASTLCAFGALTTDIRHDYKRSFAARLTDLAATELELVFQNMEQLGYEDLSLEGVGREAIEVDRHLDMRYVGQVYEIAVDVSSVQFAGDDVLPNIEERFHQEHEREYTYRLASAVPEVINSGVTFIGRQAPIRLPELDQDGRDPAVEPGSTRAMLFSDVQDWCDVPIYDGAGLRPGNLIAGPAAVEELHTTIVVPPKFNLEVAPVSAYIMRQSV